MSSPGPYWSDPQIALHLGDCAEVLAGMDTASVDAVVTDPPYGLEFMGKEWDRFSGTVTDRNFKGFVLSQQRTRNVKCPDCGKWAYDHPGRLCECGGVRRAQGSAFQAWCEKWATECLRVLKPGGFMLAMGGSRTWHRLACAVEDAGFEIRDTITWHYGAGFPKSRNVSKDLRALPACMCGSGGTASESLGVIEAIGPASPVRAGVGAEPAAVPLAGQSADRTGRIGPDVGPDAAHTSTDMQGRVKEGIGNGVPVMLGPLGVATTAEGEKVAHVVGCVKADPKPLRDQVVGDEPVSRSAVSALPVSGDDLPGNGAPSGPLVLPLPAAPGGIALAAEPAAIGDSHAVPRTVDGDSRSVADGTVTAHATGEGLHDLKCKACGGVRGHLIPDGLGTALKPATEFIVVARKPLAGTVAQNVLEHGTGALNVDGCRVGDDTSRSDRYNGKAAHGDADGYRLGNRSEPWSATAGRWPPNVLLGPEAAAELDRQSGTLTSGANPSRRGSDKFRDAYGEFAGQTECTPQRGADSGGASRFFPVFRYQAKAAAHERPRGEDGTAHPTVKPVDLMRWLVRLVTPPGGLVLDPFAGSGTTAEACIVEGFRCVLVEKDPASVELIRARMRKPIQPDMFGGAA